MNSQLEANTQALSRAQQDKVFNESMLGQQEANWKASQSGQNPETTEQQLGVLQDQLTSLQSRYTPDHPDVIKLRSQIEELKKRSSEAAKINTPANTTTQYAATETQQNQQLRHSLHHVHSQQAR